MQVDLSQEGTFLFTGDQFHVKENYHKEQPQGMLLDRSLSERKFRLSIFIRTDAAVPIGLLGRDRNAWLQSTKYIRRIETVIGAKIVFGHDKEEFDKLKQIPEHYQ